MTSTPVLLLFSVALGAVGAGVTTAFLAEPPADDSSQPAAVRPGTDLAGALAELRDENRALRERVQALEDRPVGPETRVALTEAGTSFDAFEQEVRAWMASMQTAQPSGPVRLDDVADALDTLRDEERLAKQQIAVQRRDEWISGRVAKLTPYLGLDARQAEDLTTVLRTRAEANEELKQAWQGGGDNASLGETKRANQEDYETSLARVLTPEQLELFRAAERNSEK